MIISLHVVVWCSTLATRMNNDGLTVLTYAANLGRVKMFEEILKQRQVVLWVYGPVTCSALPLEELDLPLPVEEGAEHDKPLKTAIEHIIDRGTCCLACTVVCCVCVCG